MAAGFCRALAAAEVFAPAGAWAALLAAVALDALLAAVALDAFDTFALAAFFLGASLAWAVRVGSLFPATAGSTRVDPPFARPAPKE